MTKKSHAATRTLVTIAIGFTGAALATGTGLPAGALLGSSLAAFLASCFNVSGTIPPSLRIVAFAIIGCSLGSGLTKNFVSQAMHWPLSLGILTISVMVIMLIGGWFLSRFFNLSPETAILSTSPGALAYTLSITADGVGDARSIVVIQSIRVMGLIVVLPLLLGYFCTNEPRGGTGENVVATMSIAGFVVLFVATLGAGRWLELLKLPSAYLLTGTMISAVAHVGELVSGRPPALILFMGFALTGTAVGSRFSRISLGEMRRLLKVSLIVTIGSSSIAALFAYITSSILSLSFAQVFVAYAPGGIEAMAAMALSLGYDPAFVAGHHLFRLGLLFVLIPVLLKILGTRLQT